MIPRFISLVILCSLTDVLFHEAKSAEIIEVSPSESKIWGPGLEAEIVVPVRYFYIQAVGIDGVNLTDSPGDVFKININSPSGARVRGWPQVLDRNDGTFLVRYKLFNTVKDVQVEVTYNGKHVADSPYLLKGLIYHEKCYCPVGKVDKWLTKMQCPKSYRQIKQDLSLYKNIDMEKVEKDLVSRFSQRGSFSLCHYVVKNNKIYRKTQGEHVGFKMFMDAMLLSLTRKVKLPDIEFFVNLGDWPLEKRKTSDNPQPVFSWCGSDDTRDIVMPTYDVTESTLETLGRCEQESGTLEMPTYQTSESDLKNTCRVSLDLMSVQGNTGPKWENKTEVALFRGRDSRQERLDLAEMSLKHPDLIDAKLTNMFFFKKDESKHGPLVKHISFFDFFKWKYQLNIDGTVAAYRFPYLLAGGSLVFKQDSPYYEHFYKQLEPYKHYVPFKRDLSDLMEKLIWAKEHDEEAKEIARNGQLFVRDNLMAVDIFCYHVVLFKEYAKLLKSPVEVRDGMELVDQPSDHESKCECGRKTKKAKKAKNKKDEL